MQNLLASLLTLCLQRGSLDVSIEPGLDSPLSTGCRFVWSPGKESLERIAKLADFGKKGNRLVSFSRRKKNIRKFGIRADWKDKEWLPRSQLGFHSALTSCSKGGRIGCRTDWLA
jgi:hypothetical protein